MQDTKLIHRNLLNFCTLTKEYQKEKLGKQFHLPLYKKKYIGINLHKETKDVYSENYKSLMKEIEDNTTDGKIDHVLALEESILSK